MNAGEMLTDLYRLSKLALAPEPMYVYKPRPDGSGVAMKLNLRLEPIMIEANGAEYIDDVDGGLFLELCGQVGKTDDGKYAKFGWDQDAKRVSAKLGLADQLAFLTAIREVRYRGKPVPTHLRNKRQTDEMKAPLELSLFHSFGKSSTGITYTFQAETSALRISKSKDAYRSISLTLMDELQFEAYLKLALDAYLKVGTR